MEATAAARWPVDLCRCTGGAVAMSGILPLPVRTLRSPSGFNLLHALLVSSNRLLIPVSKHVGLDCAPQPLQGSFHFLFHLRHGERQISRQGRGHGREPNVSILLRFVKDLHFRLSGSGSREPQQFQGRKQCSLVSLRDELPLDGLRLELGNRQCQSRRPTFAERVFEALQDLGIHRPVVGLCSLCDPVAHPLGKANDVLVPSLSCGARHGCRRWWRRGKQLSTFNHDSSLMAKCHTSNDGK
ncbi:hypothetical protein RA8CHR_04940 [Variovorax sp. RA8]|nr:hypothetical protein RA8CHR_04940 [Variovorax sp. RA8]